jgi:hypothetical protein
MIFQIIHPNVFFTSIFYAKAVIYCTWKQFASALHVPLIGHKKYSNSNSKKFYSKGTRVYLTIVHNNTESYIIYHVYPLFSIHRHKMLCVLHILFLYSSVHFLMLYQYFTSAACHTQVANPL